MSSINKPLNENDAHVISSDSARSYRPTQELKEGKETGIYQHLFGDYTNLILKAFTTNDLHSLKFLINNNVKPSYDDIDEQGRSIVHYFASSKDDEVKSYFKKLLPNINVDYLNIEDENGYTPLIYSVRNENNDIANALLEAGANKSTSKNNVLVQTATEYTNDDEQGILNCVNCSVKKDIPNSEEAFIKPDAKEPVESDLERKLKTVVKQFLSHESSLVDTLEFRREDCANMSTHNLSENINQTGGSLDREDFFVQEIIGGKKPKKTIQSTRKMNGYSSSSANSSSSIDEDNYGIKSVSANTSDEFSDGKKRHDGDKDEAQKLTDESIEKIKSTLGVDIRLARCYKAALWKQIKDDDSFRTASLVDKATELLKRAGEKSVLKKITIDEEQCNAITQAYSKKADKYSATSAEAEDKPKSKSKPKAKGKTTKKKSKD